MLKFMGGGGVWESNLPTGGLTGALDLKSIPGELWSVTTLAVLTDILHFFSSISCVHRLY